MESGRARFWPASSKAVPWSGLVRGKGRPRVTCLGLGVLLEQRRMARSTRLQSGLLHEQRMARWKRLPSELFGELPKMR